MIDRAQLIAIGAIDNDCINQGFHTLDAFDFRDFLLQSSPALLKGGFDVPEDGLNSSGGLLHALRARGGGDRLRALDTRLRAS